MTTAPAVVATAVPALYETTIAHVRQSPFKHAFTYRSYWWLVDLDALPVLPRGLRSLAVFRPSDHVGGGPTIRAGIDALLAAEGLSCDRVLMLGNARTLGHVFNPITVHWCLTAAGDVVAVVAEVHNTYGGRHAYVLRPDADGRARADKSFYVSPFHEVDGHYEMRLPLPGDELRINLTYSRPGARPFVATVRGTRTPATTRSVLATALRHPLSTRAVALRIRVQGIRLYLRRLPVVPRSPEETTP
ncbi:MAG: DUF1365 domain-containing protein [Mycobacteriales bacterium]